MSFTILNKKLDALNAKEKHIRQVYDVRGTNKHQHRYIQDLKEDFKEDLILRYGNKPYGLGWHENELAGEEEEHNQNNTDNVEEVNLVEDDDEEENEKENEDFENTDFALNSNVRPISGRVQFSSPQNRPFSASAGRPLTASSQRGGNPNSQMFMFQNRPISAINAVKHHFGNQELIDLQLHKTPQSAHARTGKDAPDNTMAQPSQLNTTKMKVNESIFWKNTKKYDISKSTKQFDTKQLLFDAPLPNPKFIATADFNYTKDTQIHGMLEASKLKAPKNYAFEEVANSKRRKELAESKEHFRENLDMLSDEESDAKLTFNQSLSYIQLLRIDTPSENKLSTTLFSQDLPSLSTKKLQRPVTAHPLISTTSASSNLKKPLETIAEHVQSRQVYFSSLSDLRKRTFFLKLHSIEANPENHPNSNKELKAVDWNAFGNIAKKEDFQSLHLLLLDLNSFDHARYELEFKNGVLSAKDKDSSKKITEVYSEFLATSKTNLAHVIIYYETTTNKMIEVFTRVLVYEKRDSEYELQIWRNIYRFLLHKLVLANSPLYPESKTYSDFSKIIKEIIDDSVNHISLISSHVHKLKDYPIIIERNGLVYNFDFHSYVFECSSFYQKSLENPQQEVPKNQQKAKVPQIADKKARPFSAVTMMNKVSPKGNQQLQALQRVPTNGSTDSEHILEPMLIPSSQAMHRVNTSSQVTNPFASNLNLILEEGFDSDKAFSTSRKSPNQRNSSQFLPSSEKKHKHARPDLTLQGGKMEILHTKIVPWSTVRSSDRLLSHPFASPSGAYSSDMDPYNMQFVSPKAFNSIFEHDPNGITVRYKKSLVRKKNSFGVQRPQSSQQKKQIKPHHSVQYEQSNEALRQSRDKNIPLQSQYLASLKRQKY